MLHITHISRMSQWNRPPSGSKRKSEFMDPERLENYHLPLSQQSNISQSSEADSSPHSYQEGQTLKTISTFPPLTLQSRIPTDVVETRIDASFHSSPSKMRLPIPSATSSATLTLPPIALSSPGSASYTPQSGNLPPKSGTDYLTIQLLQRENTDLASAYTQAQTHIADLDTMFQASRVENGKLAKERQRLTGKMEFLEAQLDEVEQSIQQSQEHTAAKDAQYSRIVDLSTRLQNEWSFEKKSMQSVISYLTNEVDGLRKAYVGPAKVTNLLPSPVEDNSNETENNPNTTAESSSHELIAEMKALRLANARMKDALAEVRGDNEKLAECVEKLGSVEKDIRTHLRKVESARGSLNLFDGEGTTAKE